jgi:selenophosphate synthetase-related protein
MRRLDRGEDAERAEDHRRIARENGTRIIGDPRIALTASRGSNRPSPPAIWRCSHRHSTASEQFDQVMAAVRGSPELVALGKDGRDQERSRPAR